MVEDGDETNYTVCTMDCDLLKLDMSGWYCEAHFCQRSNPPTKIVTLVEWSQSLAISEFVEENMTRTAIICKHHLYLNVTGRPIVHKDASKDVLVSLFNGDWIAQSIQGSAEEEGHLKFKVHQLARAEDRRFVVGRLGLTPGSADWCSGNDHRAASTMIADWEVFPVGHQGILFASERKITRLG